MSNHDVIILGAGPAGLAAAAELRRLGVADVVVLDRESQAGGIPRHCGHTGYGLRQFGRWMTGPEFSRRLVARCRDVDIRTGHSALKLEANGSISITSASGAQTLSAKTILLAMGARETPRSTRLISGGRPWGVTTTGALQQSVYLHGRVPFKRPVVVGSELVAFSTLLTLRHAGVRPVAIIEEQGRITAWRPASWIARLGFGVPVLTGCSDLRIHGVDRVEGLSFIHRGVAGRIDGDGIVFTGRFRPESALLAEGPLELDPGTRGPAIDQYFRCSLPNYFAAGNLLRGIETAGQCFREGEAAARAIHDSLHGRLPTLDQPIPIEATGAMAYVYPQRLTRTGIRKQPLLFKARAAIPCTGRLRVLADGREVWSRTIRALPERRISWCIPTEGLEDCQSLTVDLQAHS